MTTGARVGFAILYRWRVAPDKEAAFLAAWRTLTELIMSQRGGLGSRLHRAPDGTFVAYAQWPSEEAWRQAADRAKDEVLDEAAVAVMRDAIVERFPETPLHPIADLLVHARG